VAAHGLLPPPDPETQAADLAGLDYRTVQREGIEYKGLHYRSPALAALRARSHATQMVKIKIDPLDMTRIWFIDPRDNQKEAVIEDAKRYRGRHLFGSQPYPTLWPGLAPPTLVPRVRSTPRLIIVPFGFAGVPSAWCGRSPLMFVPSASSAARATGYQFRRPARCRPAMCSVPFPTIHGQGWHR
jgi:Mu transposase, C-terminal